MRFRRDATFIAVRPIRLRRTAIIDVGERIPNGYLRLYHLRQLYRRLRIGQEGDPWTEGQIARWAKRTGKPIEIRDYNPDQGVTREEGDGTEEVVAEVDDLRVVSLGKGWFSVRDPSGAEVDKLRGQSAVDAWVESKIPSDSDSTDSEPEPPSGGEGDEPSG